MKKILSKAPLFNILVKKYKTRNKLNTERKLIENKPVTAHTDIPSIIHFSMNKAATQHIKKILFKMASLNKVIPVAINDYAFGHQMPFLDHLSYE